MMANCKQETRPLAQLVLSGGKDGFSNPRASIDARGISELAGSIERDGLLYPLCVWETMDGRKKINVVVEGGRRLRAIQKLVKEGRANGLGKAVPVRIVRATSRAEANIIALVGNIQRVNLSSYEVAVSMAALRSSGLQQKAIAEKIGKSRSWVSRKMAALDGASDFVLSAWKSGELPDEDVESLASVRTVDTKSGKLTKKPDHVEQNRRLEKIMAHRKVGTDSKGKVKKDAASKARSVARGGAAEPVKRAASAAMLASYAKATETSKIGYIRGMHDMAEFALGRIGAAKFDQVWLEYATAAIGKGDGPAKKPLVKRSRQAAKRSPAKKKGGK